MLLASYAMMPFLWVWSVIIVGAAWGLGWLYFLNFFLGVGAVFGAFAVSLFAGHWSIFGQLVVFAIAISALRMAGLKFAEQP
jgi:uncharacterized membrane protein YjjB (DUF3815 family)